MSVHVGDGKERKQRESEHVGPAKEKKGWRVKLTSPLSFLSLPIDRR